MVLSTVRNVYFSMFSTRLVFNSHTA
jgi:hypothetical protein